MVAVGRRGKAAKEPLDRVENRQVLEALTGLARQGLKCQVLLATRLAATDLHSSTCRTLSNPARACGQCFAMAISVEG